MENPDTKLRIEPTQNSKVKISIGSSELEFDSVGASYIVGRILEAAKQSHRMSGKPLPDFMKDRAIWAVLLTSAMGLGPSQLANHESLLMQFGETVLALPIGKSQLRQLGEAMIALSAQSDRGH
jgi:hypothetical protein